MILLATARELPRPDDDEPLLRQALAARGVLAETRAWDDPSVDWGRSNAVVIRSTWNYVRHHRAFVAWAEDVGARTQLWNPPSIVRWNSHKSYLLDLERKGVPVVPTELVNQGGTASVSTLLARWPELVIKPAVSAGSFGTLRVNAPNASAGQAHLNALAATGDVLVQPYLRSVEGYGERALVWLGGALTHAVRKSPRFAGDAQRISEAVPIAVDEAALAEHVLTTIPETLLYARVDVVRDDAGSLRVMELELIEPALFLDRSPDALNRFADAIAGL
jgi:glutathione synthase/RimK-type ligase-like ATP-grasp enzyme